MHIKMIKLMDTVMSKSTGLFWTRGRFSFTTILLCWKIKREALWFILVTSTSFELNSNPLSWVSTQQPQCHVWVIHSQPFVIDAYWPSCVHSASPSVCVRVRVSVWSLHLLSLSLCSPHHHFYCQTSTWLLKKIHDIPTIVIRYLLEWVWHPENFVWT